VRQRFAGERDVEDNQRLEAQHEAKRLEAESQRLARESDAKLRPHERLALALGFLQIGIALTAITVLTRRRWLLWGAAGAALVGVGGAIPAMLP